MSTGKSWIPVTLALIGMFALAAISVGSAVEPGDTAQARIPVISDAADAVSGAVGDEVGGTLTDPFAGLLNALFGGIQAQITTDVRARPPPSPTSCRCQFAPAGQSVLVPG